MKCKASLHEIRKANNKLRLLENTLKRLNSIRFEDINVNDVCKDSEISKVSYYNYFPNKGDILLYFMSIWSYKLEVHINEKNIKGLNAIEEVFDFIFNIDCYYNLLLGLISFISTAKEKPVYEELTKVEKNKILPDKDAGIYEVKETKLYDFFIKHLSLAEIESENTFDDRNFIAMELVSLFYGGPLSLMTLENKSLKDFYKKSLKRILYTK